MPDIDQAQLDLELVREIGKFTTSLIPISEARQASIDYPGTGTFVSVDGAHYVLTAMHVWEKLRRAPEVGFTLREALNHKYSIPTAALAVFGPDRPSDREEWGPDLALLRLPLHTIPDISIHKIFYNLRKERRSEGDGGELIRFSKTQETILAAPGDVEIEGRIVMGTPMTKATISAKHATLLIDGIFVGLDAIPYSVGEYDYVDFKFPMVEGIPRTFEGVSGGGLWRYFNHVSKTTKKGSAEKVLEGLAFYQSPLENEERTIRCHSKQSIQKLLEFAP